MKEATKKLEELLVNTVKAALSDIKDSNIELKVEAYYEERVFQHSSSSGSSVTYTPKINLELKTGNRV